MDQCDDSNMYYATRLAIIFKYFSGRKERWDDTVGVEGVTMVVINPDTDAVATNSTDTMLGIVLTAWRGSIDRELVFYYRVHFAKARKPVCGPTKAEMVRCSIEPLESRLDSK